jgi:hypothetical protein
LSTAITYINSFPDRNTTDTYKSVHDLSIAVLFSVAGSILLTLIVVFLSSITIFDSISFIIGLFILSILISGIQILNLILK